MAIIRFIIYSNIWISLGASLFTLFFYRILNQTPNPNYILLVGLLTFIAYNFQRLVKMKKAIKDGSIESIPRLNWVRKNALLLTILTSITTIPATFLLFELNLIFHYAIIISGIFSFFYVVTVPGINHSLREIPGSKIFLISLSYAICGVLLPQELIGNYSIYMWLGFFAYFLLILAITIPFDIRDIDFDDSKIKTLPQVMGIKNSKRLAYVLYIASFLLLFGISGMEMIATLIIGLVFGIDAIRRSRQKTNAWHYAITVDGILILIPCIAEIELYLIN